MLRTGAQTAARRRQPGLGGIAHHRLRRTSASPSPAGDRRSSRREASHARTWCRRFQGGLVEAVLVEVIRFLGVVVHRFGVLILSPGHRHHTARRRGVPRIFSLRVLTRFWRLGNSKPEQLLVGGIRQRVSLAGGLMGGSQRAVGGQLVSRRCRA